MRRADRLVSMDTDEMTTQVVLATEGSATGTVRADMGLQSVGVMSRHVRLQVIGSSETSRTEGAPVLLPRIALDLFSRLSQGDRSGRLR